MGMMHRLRHGAALLLAGLVGLTLEASLLGQERTFITGPAGAGAGDVLINRAEIRALPKFWIGIMGEPANDVLRSQLHLDHGVVVTDIVENSPAATAGLQKFDIVLKVNDKEVSVIEDFFAPVDAGGAEPLKLELIREGKPLVLEVRPLERPAGQTSSEVQDRLQWQLPLGQQHRLRLMGPGFVFHGQAAGGLPDNVQISVTKQGNEPAKISIQRGEESWQTTEDKLDSLPADVRAWVEPMLGRPAPIAFQLPEGAHALPSGHWNVWSDAAAGPFVPSGPAAAPIQQQLDALREQIHRLEEAMKAQQTPQPPADQP